MKAALGVAAARTTRSTSTRASRRSSDPTRAVPGPLLLLPHDGEGARPLRRGDASSTRDGERARLAHGALRPPRRDAAQDRRLVDQRELPALVGGQSVLATSYALLTLDAAMPERDAARRARSTAFRPARPPAAPGLGELDGRPSTCRRARPAELCPTGRLSWVPIQRRRRARSSARAPARADRARARRQDPALGKNFTAHAPSSASRCPRSRSSSPSCPRPWCRTSRGRVPTWYTRASTTRPSSRS